MKSIILSDTAKAGDVESALNALLPGQSHPWLLKSADGNPIAYFHVEADGVVQADMSGRHYNEDAAVSSIMDRLRSSVGGVISYAP